MVFGLVASDGKTMPPFFWPKGTKVNTDEYIKVLETVVKPWILVNYMAHTKNTSFNRMGPPATRRTAPRSG
jgi:hypothetical protein